MGNWIKKDDKVVIITGNDKGKTGVVLASGYDKVLVKGINLRKKHLKKRSEKGKSDIVTIETPIHVSNVAPCDAEGKKIKLRTRFIDGEKQLYYVESGKDVVYRTLKKSQKSS